MEYFVSKKDFLSVISLKGNFNAESGTSLAKCAEEAGASKAVIITVEKEIYSLDPSGLRAAAQFFRVFRQKKTLVRFVGADPSFRKMLVDSGLAETLEFSDSLPSAVAELKEAVTESLRRA